MILNRVLLPGEQIRQVEMAERLNVSRVPLREALKVLETEGALVYSRNQGYFVAKLSSVELSQIYLMRRLLESELIKSIAWPDDRQLDELTEANRAMETAMRTGDLEGLVGMNRVFHFLVFALSPLNVVRREVERLWALSDSYRAVYLYQAGARERVVAEHQAMIIALRERDSDSLIVLSDQHRAGLQEHMSVLLGGDIVGLQTHTDTSYG